MAGHLGVEVILEKARERERAYDWWGAAECYEQALASVPSDDLPSIGNIQERRAYALYRAAFQAEDEQEFRTRIQRAIEGYHDAVGSLSRLQEAAKGKALRCRAMIAFGAFWVAGSPEEKKKLLNQARAATKESLHAFEGLRDPLEYGKTYNQLVMGIALAYYYEWDSETKQRILEEGSELGEEAIKHFAMVGHKDELACAYTNTAAFLSELDLYVREPEARQTLLQRALDYWRWARDLSSTRAIVTLGISELVGTGTDESLAAYGEILDFAKITNDKLAIGLTLDWIAYHTLFKAMSIENPVQGAELLGKALQFAEEANKHYAVLSFISPRAGGYKPEAPLPSHYFMLAWIETDLGKKRELLDLALREAPHQLKRAKDSGCPGPLLEAHATLSSAPLLRAKIEGDPGRKKRLLEEASAHCDESIRIVEQIRPKGWKLGEQYADLSNIEAQLAGFEQDARDKEKKLREAIQARETCLTLSKDDLVFYERRGEVATSGIMGWYQRDYGDLLVRLGDLTKDQEHWRRAIESFEEAAMFYAKPGTSSDIAECYWKAARTADLLGDYPKAAESFALASAHYKAAAEKIPKLRSFYGDHATYLEAWSDIEKARYHHSRQEYGSARDYYEKAAALHTSTKKWAFLASNYSAWAQVENAENQSRNERSREAMEAFENAANRFKKSKSSLQDELNRIQDQEEKGMVSALIRIADVRQEYCRARRTVEEAKILDKEGHESMAAEKYRNAAEVFEKLMQAVESEGDRRDLELIYVLAQAWHRMAQAEAEASPESYGGASKLFEEARRLAQDERAKTLLTGHARFCKALESGAEFVDTRDPALHATAAQHLDAAARHYGKAGYQDGADYAKASKLLFDAYVYMDGATREKDPEKKSKLYLTVEKVLQAAATSFEKARQLGKRDEVNLLLERVREERELAVTLIEVIQAPSVVSATAAFATPQATYEKAVGLDRFERADVQASFIANRKEVQVGEDLSLEIDLVNAGRGPALLVKVENIAPEGFELTEKPEAYRIEDHALNLRGKRLDPLRTEEVRVVLRPRVHGVFTLKPRIMFLDESSRYRYHEPEPLEVKVKELGLTGWLKGPKKGP